MKEAFNYDKLVAILSGQATNQRGNSIEIDSERDKFALNSSFYSSHRPSLNDSSEAEIEILKKEIESLKRDKKEQADRIKEQADRIKEQGERFRRLEDDMSLLKRKLL